MRRADWWIATAALLLLAALAFDVDGWPLLDPDEGRNATVMREMAEGGHWVLPRLDSLPYLDKPVVHFAAGAAAVKLFGPTETGVRFPSLVFTLLGAAFLWLFARRLLGTDTAWVAALGWLATPFAMAYARTVIFDATLACWVILAMWAFWEATAAPRSWGWSMLAWIAVALGVLTKGPIMLLFPFLVVLPWAIWRGRGQWKAVLDPVGLLAGVVLVLPWVWAVSAAVPGFLRYVLMVETAARFGTAELGRSGPLWYFLLILPAAALPWSAVLLGGARRIGALLRERDPSTVYLVLWIAVPLLFFTVAQSKRPQYVLPLLPAITLLAARVWHEAAEQLPGARTAAAVLVAIGAALITLRERIAPLFDTTPEVAAAIPGTALALGVAALVGGSLIWAVDQQPARLLVALALPVAAIPFVAGPLMRAIAADRSAAPLAALMASAGVERPQVIAVDAWPPGLGFYLGDQVLVSTDDPAILTSNWVTRHPARAAEWPGSPLRAGLWWQRALLSCAARPRLFVARANDALTRAGLTEALPLLGETARYAVYGPCGAGGLARR